MLKKPNVKVVVYVEGGGQTGYIGLTNLAQLSQVSQKHPYAKVSVIHK